MTNVRVRMRFMVLNLPASQVLRSALVGSRRLCRVQRALSSHPKNRTQPFQGGSQMSARPPRHDEWFPGRSTSTLGGPLRLRDEGSFFVNGRLAASEWPNVPNTGMDAPGHTTVEQMYVQYRIPDSSNGLPR